MKRGMLKARGGDQGFVEEGGISCNMSMMGVVDSEVCVNNGYGEEGSETIGCHRHQRG